MKINQGDSFHLGEKDGDVATSFSIGARMWKSNFSKHQIISLYSTQDETASDFSLGLKAS